MASEGEPTNDDSFTPQQLEVIRELIVANRPPPSAEAPTAHHRPRPPAQTPGPSSGSSGAHGESLAIRCEQAHAWRGRVRCHFFTRLTPRGVTFGRTHQRSCTHATQAGTTGRPTNYAHTASPRITVGPAVPIIRTRRFWAGSSLRCPSNGCSHPSFNPHQPQPRGRLLPERSAATTT